MYKLKYRVVNGDVNLSQNSFQTPDFKPNGTNYKSLYIEILNTFNYLILLLIFFFF